MKKFLIQLVLFFLPLVLLAYGADVFISSNLKKSNSFVKGEMSVWNDLYANKVNSKVIIMGSSRAWVHLDATMIGDSLHTSAYNLGIDGHDFWMQDYRFRLAMKQPVKPKVIIQSIDIFTLAKRKDLFYSEQFLPYMLGNSELKKVTDHFIGFERYDNSIPMIRYYSKGSAVVEALKMAFGAKNEPKRIRGYQGQEEPWTNDLAIARSKMKSFAVTIDPETLRLFERYLAECQRNHIQMVFVYSPEYIEGQNFVDNRKEMIKLYEGLGKKYNIPFFDYSANPISYQKKYFYNALHMNKSGAELFTSELIHDLKGLNLQY